METLLQVPDTKTRLIMSQSALERTSLLFLRNIEKKLYRPIAFLY